MQRVQAGELDARVGNDSSGELGQLEAGFNVMAQNLEAGHEQLQERVEQATREVQESMEVIEIRNAELDLARRRAILASRAKIRVPGQYEPRDPLHTDERCHRFYPPVEQDHVG